MNPPRTHRMRPGESAAAFLARVEAERAAETRASWAETHHARAARAPGATAPLTVVIPGLRLVSESNAREHWAAKAKRVKRQRHVVGMLLMTTRARPALPCTVTLTRVAPRALDAHDNLRASCKAAVDEVTAWLGLASDADPRVTWAYAQRRGGVRQYAVEISFTPQKAEAPGVAAPEASLRTEG